MPTYEYECTQCGKVMELFQSMKDKPKRHIATECAQCNNKAPVVRRIGSGAGIIFKGSGFYQTDYRSESYKKAAHADSGASEGKAKKEGEAKTGGDSKTSGESKKESSPKKPDKPAPKSED
jgi:putative FmdB family regulatory protein